MDQAEHPRDQGTAVQSALRLSVIVPAYNVAPYLADCLDSIVAQTYAPTEVIVVDDGSTDETPAVAYGYAASHPSVRVVTTHNHGLGAARNRGVAESRGDLIAFADSDDTVAPGAYQTMVSTLVRSGSDFAVGSMRRVDGGAYNEPGWMSSLHSRTRVGLTVEDQPEILGDVFAWNKVFRRAFWTRHRLAFPERVRYEDQVAMTRAYLASDGFDVVRPVVYNWQVRADRSAITDARHELADLEDRVTTKRASLQLVESLASPSTRKVFRERVLSGDMWRYFAHVPGCTDAYWQCLREAVREFWPGDELARSPMSLPNRLVGWLVREGRRRQAATVVRYAAAWGDRVPTLVAGGDVLAELPYWNDPEAQVPLRLYRLRDDELGWRADLHSVRIEQETLVLEGSAGLDRVDLDDATVCVILTVGGRRLISRVEPAAGFKAMFSVRGLVARGDEVDTPRIWAAHVRLEARSIVYEGQFTSASADASDRLLTDDAVVEAAIGRTGLTISILPVPAHDEEYV